MVGSENSAETLPPSMEVAPRNYGVTRPLSLAGPSEADIHRNAALEKVFSFPALDRFCYYLLLVGCCS